MSELKTTDETIVETKWNDVTSSKSIEKENLSPYNKEAPDTRMLCIIQHIARSFSKTLIISWTQTSSSWLPCLVPENLTKKDYELNMVQEYIVDGYQFICMLHVLDLKFVKLFLYVDSSSLKGPDTTLSQTLWQFHANGKKSVWKALKQINDITDTFTRYFKN